MAYLLQNITNNVRSEELFHSGYTMSKNNIEEGSKKRILIVIEEINFLHSLTFTLKRKGYQVFTATNGKQAYDIIMDLKNDNNSLDLLIADMQLPGYTGKELINRIFKAKINIPILLITDHAHTVTEFISEIKPAIECVVLNKPFDSKELLKRVAELLRG